MTDIDHAPLLPEPPMQAPRRDNGKNGPARWPRALTMVGVLGLGVVLGAGSLAVAAGMDHMRWQRGARLAMFQHVVAHALDSVGASAEQEAKIHDVIAAKFADVAPDPQQHEAMRKQALELLSAPTIDRAAVEKMRADLIASLDAKSKAVVGGALEIADQLTPPQRAQLAAEIEQMAQRHGPMGPWGGPHRDHHMMMDDGADGAPDSGPDKD
jgi:periplasmic protein CpxP/Spy